jgi:hypothetical protein
VAPIVGAARLLQPDVAVGALAITLSPEDLAFVEEPYQPLPVLGH